MSEMKRINKPEARKRFHDGQDIYVLPCKVTTNSIWFSPFKLPHKDYFDREVREYEFYNCSAEVGYYSHFYIEEPENATR